LQYTVTEVSLLWYYCATSDSSPLWSWWESAVFGSSTSRSLLCHGSHRCGRRSLGRTWC